MLLRRVLLAAAVVATLAGCEPSVPKSTATGPITYAVFDPTTGQIPLPNDLAWMQAPAVAKTAQDELLQLFRAQGGFPNDQEVPITIDLQGWTTGTGTPAKTAPPSPLDLATLTPSTFVFLEKKAGASTYSPVAPDTYEVSYATGAERGTLTIRNQPDPARGGTRAWLPGSQFVVVLRGGANGAKLVGGGTLDAMQTLWLLTRGVDLSSPVNQYLLPGTREERAALGAQLEAMRQQYLPLFAAAEAPAQLGGFGWGMGASRDIVSIQTFTIGAATGTQVLADASAGAMPLPSDFLIDPATGKVVNNPAFGPLAAGIATLDGFSTTAMILAQTSGPIAVEKVNKDTVFLYELPRSGTPVRVKELMEGAGAGFVAEPLVLGRQQSGAACNTAAGCFSTAIGLQPAAPVATPNGLVALPPLKDATEYAVIITNDVLAVDVTATPPLAPLQAPTLGRILLFDQPLLANGKSQLAGIPDATAAGLEQMRLGVGAAVTALAQEKGIGKERVAMAYTFRTQTIGATAVQLAAAPYSPDLAPICAKLDIAGFDCTKPIPGTTRVYTASGTLPGGAAADGTVASVFDRYGVDASVPRSNVGTIIETRIATLNAINPADGGLQPDATKWTPEPIDVLIAVPSPTNAALQTCAGPLAALAPGKCLPLTVYHHALPGSAPSSRAGALAVANTLNGAGAVVAAIDAPMFGDRSFCSQVSSFVATNGASVDAECIPGSFCVPDPALAGQGDTVPAGLPSGVSATPGRCRTARDPAAPLGTFLNRQTLCINQPCTFATPNAGYPVASGEFFISGNLFRTRDAIRQDLIDHARLIQVLEPAPAAPPLAGQDVYNALAAQGLFVAPSPDATSLLGQSLGGFVGALQAAANPRIGRAVLNAGGATMVDTLTNSPSYASEVGALFASLGIDRTQVATDPAVATKYLTTVNVMKWILDPADPANFARNLQQAPLPNLLPPLGGNANGTVPQSAKPILQQIAVCDQTVPNPFSALLAGEIGLSPLAPPTSPGSGTVSWFVDTAGAASPDPSFGCPAGQRVQHNFLTGFGAGLSGAAQVNEAALTNDAQAQAASFLLGGTPQPTLNIH